MTLWPGRAEKLRKDFIKESAILVTGQFYQYSYTAKDGQEKTYNGIKFIQSVCQYAIINLSQVVPTQILWMTTILLKKKTQKKKQKNQNVKRLKNLNKFFLHYLKHLQIAKRIISYNQFQFHQVLLSDIYATNTGYILLGVCKSLLTMLYWAGLWQNSSHDHFVCLIAFVHNSI